MVDRCKRKNGSDNHYHFHKFTKSGASDAIRTRECSVHSRECWASSPHSP